MNEQIKKQIFTFEIRLLRAKGVSSLGDKDYETIVIMGYLKEEMKVVSYSLGREVTSSAQLYIDGMDMLKVDAKDLITVGIRQASKTVEGEFDFIPLLKERQILRRDNFYRPNNVPDVGVIYLA